MLLQVALYACTVFIKEILQWNLPASLLLVLTLAAICTISGGMTAVIATDVLQAILMIAATITITIYSE